MNTSRLFERVYEQILDYVDQSIIHRCADWGHKVYELLRKHGHLPARDNAHGTQAFIYAVSTAVIVAEFAKVGFGDHLNEGAELNLTSIGMHFAQIEGLLRKDTSHERRKLLETANVVGLQEMWGVICEHKSAIHRGLTAIYRPEQRGSRGEANDLIFESLTAVFEKKGDEEGVTIVPFHSDGKQLQAYEYVSAKFLY